MHHSLKKRKEKQTKTWPDFQKHTPASGPKLHFYFYFSSQFSSSQTQWIRNKPGQKYTRLIFAPGLPCIYRPIALTRLVYSLLTVTPSRKCKLSCSLLCPSALVSSRHMEIGTHIKCLFKDFTCKGVSGWTSCPSPASAHVHTVVLQSSAQASLSAVLPVPGADAVSISLPSLPSSPTGLMFLRAIPERKLRLSAQF